MMKVNKRNLFNFLLLSVLVPSVSGEYANNIKEQSKIAMKPQQNNSGEPSKFVITVMFLNNTESGKDTKRNANCSDAASNLSKDASRRSRDIVNNYSSLECVQCDSRDTPRSDKCYSGDIDATVNCLDGEECHTEVHPQYIKRGCMARSRLNRTFVCKCPLCNDKPFDDAASYEYKTVRDWEYDNRRLQTAVIGLDLLCKVCDTKGINRGVDKQCREGKESEYMVCGKNQLCFTNIDLGSDFVSRGCVDLPVFNYLYYFCNRTFCNNERINQPLFLKRRSGRGFLTEQGYDSKNEYTKILVSQASFIAKNLYIINIIVILFQKY